jgi:GT2 family glycosyltransferase
MSIQPFVSIIIPTKNERRSIERCVEGFLRQTYPKENIEVLIADDSEDGTRELLEDYARQYPSWLRLYDNPGGSISEGYSIALTHAKGDIIATYIGHAFPDERYIENVVSALARNGIDMVGGKVVPVPATETKWARAIAIALRSSFAVGRNAFTRDARSKTNSTHWMAVHRRWVESVGGFDSRFERGEDCDWYERLMAAGAKAEFDPGIISYYFPRDTFASQFRIQALNAWHRMRLFFLTGRGLRLHHIIPVVGIIIYLILALLVLQSIGLILFPVAVYTLALIWQSAIVAKPEYQLTLQVAFAILLIHVGHFLGVVGGLLVFSLPSFLRIFKPKELIPTSRRQDL